MLTSGRYELKIGMHTLSTGLRCRIVLKRVQYSARSQFSLGTKLAEIRKDGAEIYGNGERRRRRPNEHFVMILAAAARETYVLRHCDVIAATYLSEN